MKKELKHTDADLAKFKKECLRWIDYFGLNGWSVDFQFVDDKDVYGNMSSNHKDRVATICLSKHKDPLDRQAIERTAKHEVLHLLLARLSDLASERHVTKRELYEAEEEVVHILVNKLCEQS